MRTSSGSYRFQFILVPVHTGSGSYGSRFPVQVPIHGFPAERGFTDHPLAAAGLNVHGWRNLCFLTVDAQNNSDTSIPEYLGTWDGFQIPKDPYPGNPWVFPGIPGMFLAVYIQAKGSGRIYLVMCPINGRLN